ncbi:MAG TPA: PGF-pre-PGF domain-containing protein [Methanocorpusculum sp.]|nr:PGF-pre-PGF domain-containing protein [Methanocorpusculum sp.]
MKRNSTNRYGKLPLKAILLSLLIIFVCAAAFCGCVSADEEGADESNVIDVTNWTELLNNATEANANAGKIINITDQIVINKSITNYQNLVLDISGNIINCTYMMSQGKDAFNITDGAILIVKNSNTTHGKINSTSGDYTSTKRPAIFNVTNGSLTLNEHVLLEMNPTTPDKELLIVICGSPDVNVKEDYSKFVLNQGATLKSNGKTAITIYEGPRGTKNGYAYGVNVDIKGDIITTGKRGIHLNGYIQLPTDDKALEKIPKITIGKTAVITATKGNLDECVGIFAAGYGNWVFEDGCKVTGPDAITIKSGNFVFNGGEITANGEKKEISKDGEEIMGTALRIVGDKSFAGNVSIDIQGGTFTSVNNSVILYGFASEHWLPEGHEDQIKKLTISGSPSINTHAALYPINISNITGRNVSIKIDGQTPFYPGLNTSYANWVNNSEGNWNVTLIQDVENVMSIDLSKVPGVNKVTLNKGSHNFVKVSKDDKYLFEGWSNDTSKLGPDTKEFYGGVEYKPIFSYIKQYDTGEEVEDDEPTPTIEPTPIVTPTQNQTVTPTPTVKPTPEPKTVVIVETEVKFEDNKVITSVTVPEGSSGSITFTQTEEKGMDEWIPESIEDTYSFDLSCDGEINGDSEIHFVMSDVILKSLGLTPDDVCLKHFENGVWVKLKISYIVLDDGTYYYTAVTKSFSPFEISFDGNSEEPTVTPTEEQPTKSPMPVLGLLMGLCAALVLRRK